MELALPFHRLLGSLIELIKACFLFLFPFVGKLIDERLVAGWREEQERLKEKLVVEDVEEWQWRIWDDDDDDGDEEENVSEGESSDATSSRIASPSSSSAASSSSSPSPSSLRYVGGVDVSFGSDGVSACASLVVCDMKRRLDVVYEDFIPFRLDTPYRPGFLAFREVPTLLEAWRKLLASRPEVTPQVVLIDGNGILHPRGFGSASHFGVLIDRPTVGVAKKLYHVDGLEKSPRHKRRIEEELKLRHDAFDLVGESGAVLGVALRTGNDAKNPVYVSIGHRISLKTAVEVVKRCSSEFRVPEPIRQADIRSREWLREP